MWADEDGDKKIYSKMFYNLGLTFIKGNKPELAIKQLSRSIEIYDGNDRAHLNLGTMLCQEGRDTKRRMLIDQGIAELRRAIVIQPKDVNAYCNIGLASARWDARRTSRTWSRRDLRHFATVCG